MDTVLRGVDASKNNLNRVLPVGSGLEVKMYCPECGSEVSEDSCFCGECGCKIREADMGTENIPETKFAGGLSFPASDADKEPYQEKKSDGKTGKTSVIAKAASAILAIAGCVVLVLGITGKLDGIGARIGNAMEGNQQKKEALTETEEETADNQTSGQPGDFAKPEKAGGTGEAVGKMAAMIGEPEGKENGNEGFHDEAVVSDKEYAGWEGDYVREQGPSSSIEMIDKEKYFDLLFGCLYDSDLLPITGQDIWRYDLQSYFERTGIDGAIIEKMKEQYGIGLQNVFLINCKKNVLLCDNFQVTRNKILIQTAVYFTALGCLLDYLLDHGNNEQQAEARKKLNWEYCKCYFMKKTVAKSTSVIDILYEKVSSGLDEIYMYNSERFEYIVQLIKLAVDSEMNVNHGNLKIIEKDLILNKSIIFIKIAAEILLCSKKRVKDDDKGLIENLGYVYALIDDLNDLYEDMEIGQMNLLMEYDKELETVDGVKKIIKFILDEISKKLQVLAKNFDNRLYELILHEIRDWSMSNAELCKRIWRIN